MEIKRGGGGGGIQRGNTGDASGWEEASSEFTERVVFMDILGSSGTGRTTLALTAPGPVALINADEKINGVVQPHVRQGKRIRVATFGFAGGAADRQETAQAAAAIWDRVTNWMSDSMGWAKSTILDTGTESWELIRLARFGELNPKGRIDSNYGPVNAEFRGMFKQFRMAGISNLITIHQVKDEYLDRMVNGKLTSSRTGREIRAGFKEFQYMADVVVRTGRDPLTNQFTAVIEKGWFNAQSEGTVFTGQPSNPLDPGAEPFTCHFANIMAWITETDATEWM